MLKMTSEEENTNSHEFPEENADNKKDKSYFDNVNKDLLPSKIFYFFYFSAWGSLLPYLALYFKEMNLSPSQVGVLMGLRPFTNFICVPLWGLFVDKFRKEQYVILIALVVSVLTNFSLSLVAPAEKVCNESSIKSFNITKRTSNLSSNNPVIFVPLFDTHNSTRNFFEAFQVSSTAKPWPLVFLSLEESSKGNSSYQSTKQLFLHLLLLLVFGNSIACPSLALTDTITMHNLGEDKHKYGVQRLWGSLGFGLAAFIVGAIVSVDHYCVSPLTKWSDVNYTPCFYSFVLLMCLAVLTSFWFKFPKGKTKTTQCVENSSEEHSEKPNTKSLRGLFQTAFIMFLFTSFFFGFMIAFVKTFLFWHLKELGGTQLLFCIITAVHCVAEVSLYFLSARLITMIGHTRVLYLGLFCYATRCFAYWLISNPWLVLPLELLTGITSAAAWAAMLSFISENSPQGYATTFQGVLHAAYWGLGSGSGEMIGGLLVNTLGTANTFGILAVTSLLVMVLYMITNNVGLISGRCNQGNTQTDK